MALIKLEDKDTEAGNPTEKYRNFLQSYRLRTKKEPGAYERMEAFICAKSPDPWKRPSWCC